LRKRPAVVWNLIWTPVDVRFKDLLQQLNQHTQFVKDELALFHARQTVSAEKAAELERHLVAKERRYAEDARGDINQLKKNLQDHFKRR
jgi:hypothetical protein